MKLLANLASMFVTMDSDVHRSEIARAAIHTYTTVTLASLAVLALCVIIVGHLYIPESDHVRMQIRVDHLEKENARLSKQLKASQQAFAVYATTTAEVCR